VFEVGRTAKDRLVRNFDRLDRVRRNRADDRLELGSRISDIFCQNEDMIGPTKISP
jgi:hypothetical protein